MNEKELSPEERFIERMGLASAEDGLPRIYGRLKALMLLEGGPLSFDELSERLRVSRSSVSTNARILEDQGVIERTGIPGDRQVYYRLAEDPYTGVLATVLRRKRRAKRIVEQALDEIDDGDAARRERLETLLDFHERVISSLEELMESWHTELEGDEA